MKNIYCDEYHAGPRTVLRPGDLFRATGGPYYEQAGRDGTIEKVKMGDRGPFRFIRYCERGARKWIEAWCSQGFTVLNVGKRRRMAELPSLVNRPWKILGKVGENATKRKRRRSAVA